MGKKDIFAFVRRRSVYKRRRKPRKEREKRVRAVISRSSLSIFIHLSLLSICLITWWVEAREKQSNTNACSESKKERDISLGGGKCCSSFVQRDIDAVRVCVGDISRQR
jgi:plastocyanin domain-containing protein